MTALILAVCLVANTLVAYVARRDRNYGLFVFSSFVTGFIAASLVAVMIGGR